MSKVNYQKELEKLTEQLEQDGHVPTLCLHSCCAPCSTYVIQYLSHYFQVVVFYYNPNIDQEEEYRKRAKEQQRLIAQMPTKYPVEFVEGNYDVAIFHERAKPLAKEREGGERCTMCYELRLEETARYAKQMNAAYFTTTLTISPMKNAQKLNAIGQELAVEYGVNYLPSDFKKKEGYKKSVELSNQYGLYRQDYCGCSYSKREAMERSKQ